MQDTTTAGPNTADVVVAIRENNTRENNTEHAVRVFYGDSAALFSRESADEPADALRTFADPEFSFESLFEALKQNTTITRLLSLQSTRYKPRPSRHMLHAIITFCANRRGEFNRIYLFRGIAIVFTCCNARRCSVAGAAEFGVSSGGTVLCGAVVIVQQRLV